MIIIGFTRIIRQSKQAECRTSRWHRGPKRTMWSSSDSGRRELRSQSVVAVHRGEQQIPSAEVMMQAYSQRGSGEMVDELRAAAEDPYDYFGDPDTLLDQLVDEYKADLAKGFSKPAQPQRPTEAEETQEAEDFGREEFGLTPEEEEAEDVECVRNVERKAVVAVRRILTDRRCRAEEEETKQVERIGDIDQTTAVVIATSELRTTTTVKGRNLERELTHQVRVAVRSGRGE